ncbi:CHAP domain-containing protein [Lactococcus formosensis]|uniref:CHAP domain-containing protein n=1 Tax=Lactococcus formosensis TaxID=1281486 RepID=UPI0022E48D01|nr:CHAP domain-containing protein [Lactococcus formosensis]
MKKKLIATLMLSTVVLTAGAPLSSVKADSTEQKIAEQDSKIATVKGEAAQAQSQVDAVSTQVHTLKERQVSMKKEVEQLSKQQKARSTQIQELNKNIQERSEALEAQARSAQTEGGATNYISTLLNSKSITDAIQKVTAMATVADANKSMLEQQEADQKAIQDKLKDNQEEYAKVTRLQQDLESQADELATQEAQLKVAQLSYEATITTEEGKKQELLYQKAEAERAAQAAEEAQRLAAEQSMVAQQEKAKEDEPTPLQPSTPDLGDDSEVTPPNPGPTPPPTPGPTPPPPPIVTQNPYPAGQCTAYVWERLGGNMPTYMGNAADWVVYANAGPAVGNIIVFPAGVQGADSYYGHVGVVEQVLGNGQVVISEGNFNGGWGSQRTVSTSGVYFINPS